MIYNNSTLELYINDTLAELDEEVSIRLNNILFSPSDMSSSESDFSFSFDLPSTKINDSIFNYANVLSSPNKFLVTNKASVYSDGTLIFDGSITFNRYENNKYNVNLVVIRLFDYDAIFGDRKLKDLDWKIPFNGVTTINQINADSTSDVCFPFISYGPFQKQPYHSDEVGNKYTSKFILDGYNRWYLESFYPSVSLTSLLKRCFEKVGYKALGSALADNTLKEIFLSVNLKDGQDPIYNLANPRLGVVDVSFTASTTSDITPYTQELSFPYYKVTKASTTYGSRSVETAYNFDTVSLYDILNIGNVTVNQRPSYCYQPNEHLIVIPADGFYKIDLEVNISQPTQQLQVLSKHRMEDEDNLVDETITINNDLYEFTPVEIQLVRNYDDNIELIKGKDNIRYECGNPYHTTYRGAQNKKEWLTCFPHQDLYNAENPTEANDLFIRTTKRLSSRSIPDPSTYRTNLTPVGRSDVNDNTTTISHRGGNRDYSEIDRGYVYEDGEIMVYDPAVNPDFICGISTLSSGITSVIRNGKSWSYTSDSETSSFYDNSGYLKVVNEGWQSSRVTGNTVMTKTDVNENNYYDAPESTISLSATSATSTLHCMVYLKKNDVLQLFAVNRGYSSSSSAIVKYETNINGRLKITAASPRNWHSLNNDLYGYNSPSEFDTDLNIANFFNEDTTIRDFIRNVVDAFNLKVTDNGDNTVYIDKPRMLFSTYGGIVDIDDRVFFRDAKILPIGYPKSISVRFNIDEEEFGFVSSVPEDKIDLEDWKAYGDSGYTKVPLSTLLTATDYEKDTNFSYTWYHPFLWENINFNDEKVDERTEILHIPVISKDENMIDGYDYTESLKTDGYGLTQRFFFRPSSSNTWVYADSFPNTERVGLYIPNKSKNGMYLSYKNNEDSILKRFYNTKANVSSDMAEVEVFLNVDEYLLLKNGGLVRFNKDIYIPTEIEGYDTNNRDTTTIKMIRY